jgi:hypothetical protein
MNCAKVLAKGNAVDETLILCLDKSGSMEADDWPPSRLQGAKDACIALLEEKMRVSPQDAVGIVSFADGGRIEQLPLVVVVEIDRLKAVAQGLTTGTYTSITAGLRECERAFRGEVSLYHQIREKGFFGWLMAPQPKETLPVTGHRAKRILILSDGGHNGPTSPLPVARRLKAGEVEIDAIGIGGTKKEVDEDLLKEIASQDEAGKPRYWYIGDRAQLVKKFVSLANRLRAV